MEATAYGARHVLEVMHDAGGSGRKAFAVGGGTKGGLWPQIISDITGLTQEIKSLRRRLVLIPYISGLSFGVLLQANF